MPETSGTKSAGSISSSYRGTSTGNWNSSTATRSTQSSSVGTSTSSRNPTGGSLSAPARTAPSTGSIGSRNNASTSNGNSNLGVAGVPGGVSKSGGSLAPAGNRLTGTGGNSGSISVGGGGGMGALNSARGSLTTNVGGNSGYNAFGNVGSGRDVTSGNMMQGASPSIAAGQARLDGASQSRAVAARAADVSMANALRAATLGPPQTVADPRAGFVGNNTARQQPTAQGLLNQGYGQYQQAPAMTPQAIRQNPQTQEALRQMMAARNQDTIGSMWNTATGALSAAGQGLSDAGSWVYNNAPSATDISNGTQAALNAAWSLGDYFTPTDTGVQRQQQTPSFNLSRNAYDTAYTPTAPAAPVQVASPMAGYDSAAIANTMQDYQQQKQAASGAIQRGAAIAKDQDRLLGEGFMPTTALSEYQNGPQYDPMGGVTFNGDLPQVASASPVAQPWSTYGNGLTNADLYNAVTGLPGKISDAVSGWWNSPADVNPGVTTSVRGFTTDTPALDGQYAGIGFSSPGSDYDNLYSGIGPYSTGDLAMRNALLSSAISSGELSDHVNNRLQNTGLADVNAANYARYGNPVAAGKLYTDRVPQSQQVVPTADAPERVLSVETFLDPNVSNPGLSRNAYDTFDVPGVDATGYDVPSEVVPGSHIDPNTIQPRAELRHAASSYPSVSYYDTPASDPQRLASVTGGLGIQGYNSTAPSQTLNGGSATTRSRNVIYGSGEYNSPMANLHRSDAPERILSVENVPDDPVQTGNVADGRLQPRMQGGLGVVAYNPDNPSGTAYSGAGISTEGRNKYYGGFSNPVTTSGDTPYPGADGITDADQGGEFAPDSGEASAQPKYPVSPVAGDGVDPGDQQLPRSKVESIMRNAPYVGPALKLAEWAMGKRWEDMSADERRALTDRWEREQDAYMRGETTPSGTRSSYLYDYPQPAISDALFGSGSSTSGDKSSSTEDIPASSALSPLARQYLGYADPYSYGFGPERDYYSYG